MFLYDRVDQRQTDESRTFHAGQAVAVYSSRHSIRLPYNGTAAVVMDTESSFITQLAVVEWRKRGMELLLVMTTEGGDTFVPEAPRTSTYSARGP